MAFEANIEEIRQSLKKGNYGNAKDSLQVLKRKSDCGRCKKTISEIEKQLEKVSPQEDQKPQEVLALPENYRPFRLRSMLKPQITPYILKGLGGKILRTISPCERKRQQLQQKG